MISYILALVLFLLLSAVFSAAEATYLYSRKTKVSSDKVDKFAKTPSRFLTTVLVGNNFVNVAVSSIITFILVKLLGGKGVVVATVLGTLIILTFGEIVPKAFGIRHSHDLSPFLILSMYAAEKILKPITFLLGVLPKNILGDGLLSKEATDFDRYDIERRNMLKGISRLEKLILRDVLIPKSRVSYIDVNRSFEENLEMVFRTKYTRYPVLDSGKIIGLVLSKDLLTCKTSKIRDIVRPVKIATPDKPLIEQLKDFKKWRMHLVCVVDEHGEFEGIVTLEDILEEIVGDIKDEYDVTDEDMWTEGKIIKVRGNIPIRDINRHFNLSLPEEDGTLQSILIKRLETIPEKGAQIRMDGYNITVESVSGNFISLVRIERIE